MQLIWVFPEELPGRPWLFGTTQKFLEHFGINTIDELPGSQELGRHAETREENNFTYPGGTLN